MLAVGKRACGYLVPVLFTGEQNNCMMGTGQQILSCAHCRDKCVQLGQPWSVYVCVWESLGQPTTSDPLRPLSCVISSLNLCCALRPGDFRRSRGSSLSCRPSEKEAQQTLPAAAPPAFLLRPAARGPVALAPKERCCAPEFLATTGMGCLQRVGAATTAVPSVLKVLLPHGRPLGFPSPCVFSPLLLPIGCSLVSSRHSDWAEFQVWIHKVLGRRCHTCVFTLSSGTEVW